MSDYPLPNARDIRRRYGITLDQYVELLEAQGGVCAICGLPPKGGPLVVDHCHDALTIDGLVCNRPCNRRLVQSVRRYLADPPGHRFGWTVPAELERKTIRRREAAKPRARARAKERRAERNQGKQNAKGGTLDRIRAMTGEGESFAERTARALRETRGSA
jgi:hypothetical protein